ncbi:MAG: translocated intimin receptor Tir [Terracidiphilus sp.]
MKTSAKTKAVLTDSHFLIPALVFCIGLALLITLH